MIYELTIEIHVTGGPDLSGHFQQVTDEYAKLEKVHEQLLDCAWSFSETEHGHADVDVELSVESDTEDDAWACGSSAVRAAIQAAGGHTPNWGERVPMDEPAYRVTEESVEPVEV